MNTRMIYLVFALLLSSCSGNYVPIRYDAIKPVVITEPTNNDSDDPVIWIYPSTVSESLVIGTDKGSLDSTGTEHGGGIFVYDLWGKKTDSVSADWPNNIDIAYGFPIHAEKKDIIVFTERHKNMIRIYSVPDLAPMDGGGIPVFEGEVERGPMGIAMYTRPADSAFFVIVSRLSGPADGYLWQYRLSVKDDGTIGGNVVRKFGKFSNKKSIEAIAVDNQLGYVYYADEAYGVRKYHANPDSGNAELALFSTNDVVNEHEGIAIYQTTERTGYLLVSNQHANSFIAYPREGTAENPHEHKSLAEIPVSSFGPDGVTANSSDFGERFPQGMFITMNNNKTYQYYDWRDLQKWIDNGHISFWHRVCVQIHSKLMVAKDKLERGFRKLRSVF